MVGTINWDSVAFTTPGLNHKISDIIAAAALHFRIKESDLKGSCRARHFARPRQVVFYLARQMTRASLPLIAREVGNRDHTTVLWGARKIEELLRENREGLGADIQAVRELVLTGNPRAEVKRRTLAQLEAAAEREAEEAIARAERLKNLRRIRDMANAEAPQIPPTAQVMAS